MMVTIQEIAASLARRGFTPEMNWFDPAAIQLQVDAVIEELGEVARLLRRHGQGRQALDVDTLARETADVVIAAVCLHVLTCGVQADNVLREKLTADEARGWLHSGLTREAFARNVAGVIS